MSIHNKAFTDLNSTVSFGGDGRSGGRSAICTGALNAGTAMGAIGVASTVVPHPAAKVVGVAAGGLGLAAGAIASKYC